MAVEGIAGVVGPCGQGPLGEDPARGTLTGPSGRSLSAPLPCPEAGLKGTLTVQEISVYSVVVHIRASRSSCGSPGGILTTRHLLTHHLSRQVSHL